MHLREVVSPLFTHAMLELNETCSWPVALGSDLPMGLGTEEVNQVETRGITASSCSDASEAQSENEKHICRGIRCIFTCNLKKAVGTCGAQPLRAQPFASHGTIRASLPQDDVRACSCAQTASIILSLETSLSTNHVARTLSVMGGHAITPVLLTP